MEYLVTLTSMKEVERRSNYDQDAQSSFQLMAMGSNFVVDPEKDLFLSPP